MCQATDPAAKAAPILEKDEKRNLKRMKAILRRRGNLTCADCPAKNPLWVSFLMVNDEEKENLAALCCNKCIQQHHFELGTKRCKIKYTKMTHEWTGDNIDILEKSGNKVVNLKYEATLTKSAFDKNLVVDNEEEETKRRAKFIKHKYKKLKFCRKEEDEERQEVTFHRRSTPLPNLETEKESQQSQEPSQPQESQSHEPKSTAQKEGSPAKNAAKTAEEPVAEPEEDVELVVHRLRVKAVESMNAEMGTSMGTSARQRVCRSRETTRKTTLQVLHRSASPVDGTKPSRRHTTKIRPCSPKERRRSGMSSSCRESRTVSSRTTAAAMGGSERVGSRRKSMASGSARSTHSRRKHGSSRGPRRTRSKSMSNLQSTIQEEEASCVAISPHSERNGTTRKHRRHTTKPSNNNKVKERSISLDQGLALPTKSRSRAVKGRSVSLDDDLPMLTTMRIAAIPESSSLEEQLGALPKVVV